MSYYLRNKTRKSCSSTVLGKKYSLSILSSMRDMILIPLSLTKESFLHSNITLSTFKYLLIKFKKSDIQSCVFIKQKVECL